MERKFPASFDHLYAMLDFIRDHATSSGIVAEKISHVEIAVEEVVSNIIKHSGIALDSSIHIHCIKTDPTGIQITIHDEGIAFNPQNQPQKTLGIHLIFLLMDKVEYSRKDNRNVLTLYKK